MGYFKRFVIFMLTTSVVACSLTQSEKGGVTEDLGTIYISEKVGNTGDKCQLKPQLGDHEYRMKDTGCKSDQARYFRFDGVPSAVLVRFYDDSRCRDDEGNWIFEVRTTQQPTTTTEMELKDVFGHDEKDIVAPGVVLEHKNLRGNDNQIEGKLSCTKISY